MVLSDRRYEPVDLRRHVFRDVDLYLLKPYLNLQMLLGKHLGLKGSVSQLLKEKDPKALDLMALVDELFEEVRQNKLIRAHGMYRFFPAQAEGDTIYVYDPKQFSPSDFPVGAGKPDLVDYRSGYRSDERERFEPVVLARFLFPRQQHEPYRCLADYLKPVESGEMDYLGLFAVTAGIGVREVANHLKEQGEYLKSHAYQALALELAEAFAEWIHQLMRDSLGCPDPVELSMSERFQGKYRGVRVSFGYPACPDLAQQETLFQLLQPQDIGIELTESFMMDPEASVTALVFSHPEAKWFSV